MDNRDLYLELQKFPNDAQVNVDAVEYDPEANAIKLTPSAKVKKGSPAPSTTTVDPGDPDTPDTDA